MVISHGLHHLHKRKRIYKKHEPYPHPNSWKRFLDKFIYVVATVAPLSAIPQLWQIFVEKDATGVSALTWGCLMLVATCWLTYGITHKEKPIILMYILWLFMEGAIVVGTLLYS